MAFNQIGSSQTQAKAAIDEQLMDTGVRLNFDDHESRILQLEALVGGGAEEIDVADLYATLESDPRFVSNEGVLYQRRFHADSNFNSNIPDVDGLSEAPDFGGSDKEFIRIIEPEGASGTINHYQNDTNYFKGSTAALEKDSKVEINLKRGYNFIGIGIGLLSSSTSDSVTILIDGQTPSSLGLVDQDGNAALDTFSTNSTNVQHQRTIWYFGLDSDRHLITLENTDSATKEFYFNFLDVGYVSRDYTIDNKVQFNKFKASIKGVSTNFDAEELTIDQSDGYGHTALVVGDAAGNLRTVKGLEGAKTTLKAGETISFSSAVTTLPCMNTSYFPDKGICILHHPNGENYVFSYGSKTETSIQSHSLDDIIWQKQPSEDYDIETGFEDVDALNTSTLNCLVSFWADSTLEVDTGNNKIDFSITINDNTGTPITTDHTATIPVGHYSADVVPITEAIERAMIAAKDISGEDGRYLVQWDKVTQRYRLGVDGKNIVSIDFDFATGANFASSIHSDLGYNDADISGDKVYYANNTKNHKHRRAYIADKQLWTARHPNIKWCNVATVDSLKSEHDVHKRRSIGDNYGHYGNGSTGNNFPQCTIYPDKDAAGIAITLSPARSADTAALEFSIDDSDQMYLYDNSIMVGTGSSEHKQMQTIFIPFPRGSRKIQIASNRLATFCRNANSFGWIDLVGVRQYFSRPLVEDLDTDSEQIIKALDVAPNMPRFRTIYAHNSGSLYVPGANDSLDSITETGASWTPVGPSPYFNAYGRDAQTNGDYVEIDFTIPSGGTGYGGIGVMHYREVGAGVVQAFISSTTINEGTDLIKMYSVSSSSNEASDGHELFKLEGIPSGSYTLRLKQVSTNTGNDRFFFVGVAIYTDSPEEENKYANPDRTSNGMGISHPVNAQRDTVLAHNGDRIKDVMKLHHYKFGEPSNVRYSVETAIDNPVFSSLCYLGRRYYSNSFRMTQTDYVEGFQLCKSILYKALANDTYSQNMIGFIDGRQAPNSWSDRQQVKGGTANTTRASVYPAFTKNFEATVTMSGKVVSLSDTRGVRVGQRITLVDNVGATETNYVESISADVSVTVRNPLSVLTDTNVTTLKFHGLHSIKARNDDTSNGYASTIEFEPLDLTPSRFKRLVQSGSKLEKVSVIHQASNGYYLSEPIFSDGNIPGQQDMDYYFINQIGGFSCHMHNYPYVFASGSNPWIRVTAVRMVADNSRIFSWEY